MALAEADKSVEHKKMKALPIFLMRSSQSRAWYACACTNGIPKANLEEVAMFWMCWSKDMLKQILLVH